MEQARCLMWIKQKSSMSSSVRGLTKQSYGDSWEEQAFAEDTAGPLGGFTWPPRSYSCSFCRREFKSAQALGGHMNVHRRDRARLNQENQESSHHHHHHQNKQNTILNHFSSLDFQDPYQVCNLVYNPNSNSNQEVLVTPSRVPNLFSHAKSEKNPLSPSFSSLLLKECHKKSSTSSLSSWSNKVQEKQFIVLDSKNGEKNPKFEEAKCRANGDNYLTTDLSINLNLVVCRSQQTSSGSVEEVVRCKRKKIYENELVFFQKVNSFRHDVDESAVLELGFGFLNEDLDLELRLGKRPKLN